jgi:membrane-bound ClpP family serine protease
LLWAIQKTVFTILAIAAIILAFRVKLNQTEKWWGVAILIYTSALASVITLSTPNFGTLIRYEVAYMPFLWVLILIVLNKYKQNLK